MLLALLMSNFTIHPSNIQDREIVPLKCDAELGEQPTDNSKKE
jgi:hypothetical protein